MHREQTSLCQLHDFNHIYSATGIAILLHEYLEKYYQQALLTHSPPSAVFISFFKHIHFNSLLYEHNHRTIPHKIC